MSESKHTRAWCKGQESIGALTYPLVGSRYAPPGWPDRIYHHFNWSGYIEFKAYKGKVALLQQRIHRLLLQRRASVVVVRFSVNWKMIRIERPNVSSEYNRGQMEYTVGQWITWGMFLDTVLSPIDGGMEVE